MRDRMSARQLAVASFTGLLALAAATAGLDWRGALAAVPVTLAAAWCWNGLSDGPGGWAGSWSGLAGRALSLLYMVWAVALAGAVLAVSGGRMTAPLGTDRGWVAALVWGTVLLLARGKPAAFGRAAEIFYLAMLGVAGFVLLLGAAQVKLERLLLPTGRLLPSFLTAAGVGCCGVAAVLLWEGEGGVARPRWGRWTGALACVLALMCGVTAGTLGPTLAAAQERPFFIMTVGLGQTARVEGLVSSLWLLADVTLAGLLLRCGRRMWRTAGLPGKREGLWPLSLAALGLALWLDWAGLGEAWLKGWLPIGGLVLGGGVPLLAWLIEKLKKLKKRG